MKRGPKQNYDAKLIREQARTLKRRDPQLTNVAIAEKLGIHPSTAGKYLQGLAFKRECRRWTALELSELETCAETIPATLIAQKLKREEQSVYSKADQLGLDIRAVSNIFSDTTLADAIGVDTHTIQHWIGIGLLKAKKTKTESWAIKARSFAAFCLNHPELVAHLNSPILTWLRKETCAA